MRLLKFDLKFWANLSLVVGTLYVIVFYFFTPPNNLCQMTFMMEPPKFLPVPLEFDKNPNNFNKNSGVHLLEQESIPGFHRSKYILYLYSELGFPHPSNLDRDLRDSVPVLFIPGSAGSYQQVRSLASTCIRYQLQSLKASKFAFYTIDFRKELSGVDGRIIEQQTLFVDKAIKQILRMHSNEATGVILIGHSVGGFISKALFSLPDFKAETVPLLINLASPLTSPHIYFDKKTRELYDRTNNFWYHNKPSISGTISISISGGKLDRLVPTHLSMDPHYDMCLTTSSIKDVWLAADHVSITWCRELIQKLSSLLSALIDKRSTRLISDKKKALSIIKGELLLEHESKTSEYKLSVINKDWKTIRPFVNVDYNDFFSSTRGQLSETIIILNMTQKKPDILIHIDHIESIKDNAIYACKDFQQLRSGHINCGQRIDLTHLATPIPTRRYEAKKTIFKLSQDVYHDHIIIDFVVSGSDYSRNKLPELLTVQNARPTVAEIYIPNILEFLVAKYIEFRSFEQEVINLSQTNSILHDRYKLLDFNHDTRIYSLLYKSENCSNVDGQSRGSTIALVQDNYLIDSFHPDRHSKSMSVTIKLHGQKLILPNKESQKSSSTYLELYLDGTCKSHKIILELNLLDLIISIVQKNIDLILNISLVSSMVDMFRSEIHLSTISRHKLYGILGNKAGYLFHSIIPILLFQKFNHLQSMDKLSLAIIIYVLSMGLIAFMKNVTSRIIDLAIIVQRGQLFLSKKINQDRRNHSSEPEIRNESNGVKKSISTKNSFYLNESKWIGTILVSFAGTFILPSFGMMMLLVSVVMSKIDIKVKLEKHSEQINNNVSKESEKTNERRVKLLDCTNSLYESLMTWCIFFLIYTIPSSLTKSTYLHLLSVDGLKNYVIENMAIFLFIMSTTMRLGKLDKFIKSYREDYKNSTNSSVSVTNYSHSLAIHSIQFLLIGNFLLNYINSNETVFWSSIPYLNYGLLWVYIGFNSSSFNNDKKSSSIDE